MQPNIRYSIKKQCLVLLVMIVTGWLFPVSVQAAPSLSSSYYCVMDRETGQEILGKNAQVQRPVASTTKMMTAILTVEYDELQETAEVSPKADRTLEYTIGLKTGQKLTVGELVKVALIRSANDAAVVLAEHTAGDEQFFAYLMSKKAFAIGAMQTRFQNASGLPDKNHFSTAYDLALIGRYALTKDYIRQMVATTQTEFKHPGYQQPLTIRNTNAALLQGYPGADGIKTGTTDAAGKCLVASATRGDQGLVAVVLKAGDRLGDSVKLLNYGFKSTTRQKIVDSELALKTLKVADGETSSVEVMPGRDLWLLLGEKPPNIEKKVSLNYNLFAPLKKGQVIGAMDVYIDGAYFNSVDLVCAQDIDKQSWFGDRIIRHIIKLTQRNESVRSE